MGALESRMVHKLDDPEDQQSDDVKKRNNYPGGKRKVSHKKDGA